MFSGGQTTATPATAQTAASARPMNVFAPQLTPYMQGSSGGKVNINVDGDKADSALMWNGIGQLSTTGANLIIGIGNALTQSDAISANQAIAEKYYSTSSKIAEQQAKVAIKQLDVQESSLYVSERMHGKQVEHEQRMAKISGNVNKAIEAEKQKGLTDRARIVSSTAAFQARNTWNAGSPAMYDVQANPMVFA